MLSVAQCTFQQASDLTSSHSRFDRLFNSQKLCSYILALGAVRADFAKKPDLFGSCTLLPAECFGRDEHSRHQHRRQDQDLGSVLAPGLADPQAT